MANPVRERVSRRNFLKTAVGVGAAAAAGVGVVRGIRFLSELEARRTRRLVEEELERRSYIKSVSKKKAEWIEIRAKEISREMVENEGARQRFIYDLTALHNKEPTAKQIEEALTRYSVHEAIVQADAEEKKGGFW